MLEIKETDKFVLTENIFLQKISELEKYWVFNINSGDHYSLNETSYWVLEQIAKSLPLKSILENFLETFDIDNEEGKNDLFEITKGFLNEAIIKKGE